VGVKKVAIEASRSIDQTSNICQELVFHLNLRSTKPRFSSHPFKLMDRRYSGSGNRSTLADLSNSLPILIFIGCVKLRTCALSLVLAYFGILGRIYPIIESNFLKLYFIMFLKLQCIHIFYIILHYF